MKEKRKKARKIIKFTIDPGLIILFSNIVNSSTSQAGEKIRFRLGFLIGITRDKQQVDADVCMIIIILMIAIRDEADTLSNNLLTRRDTKIGNFSEEVQAKKCTVFPRF